GTPNAKSALASQDGLLGQLRAQLQALGLEASTDLIVVSDHAHASVSGPQGLFPLRAVVSGPLGATTGGVDPTGFAVSGDVRLADLLSRAGFAAYDGAGCLYDPVLSGIKADGTPVYPTLVDDANGTFCGTPNKQYTTPSYRVPTTLPPGGIVVAP